ncbi:unnamed protein product [Fraxinus pennsylvanica]|uniref:F-box domain-containing protein n=1 Tax=Fraxinus pennsylvanica TaxID=56036 RepID=A0AAD1ZCE6_9LAMI|nr:unnamed protein product [Fraxinus pennsylvanica]
MEMCINGKSVNCISTDAAVTTATAIATSTSGLKLPILELPVHIIVDILSRIPLKDILRCRCVCKTILKLLKDPYFAEVHLARALTTTSNLIIREHGSKWGSLYFFTFDLGEAGLSSCCGADWMSHSYLRHLHPLSRINFDFSFRGRNLAFIGSCNGLLCLYYNSQSKPFYSICNPILQEYTELPDLAASTPSYIYSNLSAFGFCPRTKQYKVIRFLWPTSVDPLTSIQSSGMVADIHTLGSDSWRRIENPVWLKQQAFDPFVNGALHWITTSHKPSELISSFDLETEQFRLLPPPPHFSLHYVKNVSWINIGVLRECLCLCYIYEDAQFEAWVMKKYGVKESWTKKFSIDMKLYCNLRVEDLHRPIKFLSNGDLCFLFASNSLVSFNPKKKTFRELKKMGPWRTEVTAHVLSFISLKDAVGAKRRSRNPSSILLWTLASLKSQVLLCVHCSSGWRNDVFRKQNNGSSLRI